MLNTNYWSSACFKRNPNITHIADLQMKWLESELKKAKLLKKKVILCGHIPPGYVCCILVLRLFFLLHVLIILFNLRSLQNNRAYFVANFLQRSSTYPINDFQVVRNYWLL